MARREDRQCLYNYITMVKAKEMVVMYVRIYSVKGLTPTSSLIYNNSIRQFLPLPHYVTSSTVCVCVCVGGGGRGDGHIYTYIYTWIETNQCSFAHAIAHKHTNSISVHSTLLEREGKPKLILHDRLSLRDQSSVWCACIFPPPLHDSTRGKEGIQFLAELGEFGNGAGFFVLTDFRI